VVTVPWSAVTIASPGFAGARSNAERCAVAIAIAMSTAACGHRPTHGIAVANAQHVGDDDVTLFRDGALVRQMVELELPRERVASVKVLVASGVGAEQVLVVDRGGLQLRAVRALAGDPAEPSDAPVDDDLNGDDGGASGGESGSGSSANTAGAMSAGSPTELELEVAGPRPGKYRVDLAYTTEHLRWDAAYTMTANEAHDRVVVRGALALRNATGVTYRANAHLVDSELMAWRGKVAEKLATELAGGAPPAGGAAATRELGQLEVVQGETRVELLSGSRPRAMRSVLVYDPVGTKLDNASAQPVFDAALGANVTSNVITESFEVERDAAASDGLPAGPVRLLERHPDASVTVLGEARLFDASTRVAQVDTIAIGTSEGVTARRVRRELTNDQDNKRLVEEFEIDIDNTRPAPAAVLVREHLYRGQNWTLAYYSSASAAKEGPQQIALRTTVPARSRSKLLYVVVYTW
jgi:hypothetical protein